MKPTHYLSRVLVAAALCGAVLESSGQLTQSYTNTFDTASSVASWNYMWYALNNVAMSWDSTKDAASNANSGSLRVAIPWGTNSQQLWGGTWGNTSQSDNLLEMNGAFITNISCDIHVDPSSPVSSSGNFGPLEFGFLTQYGMTYPNNSTIYLPLSATNGWMHISMPVATTSVGLRGLGFQMYTYSGALNGTTLFWIDNLKTEATLNYTNSFDAAPGNSAHPGSAATSWIYWQGVNSANSAMSWDSAADASGSSSSGSLKVSIPWKNGNASGANLSQTMFGTFANRSNFDNGETASGYNFQEILCSVHVDPSSPMNAAGNYGVLQIGFVNDVNGTWSGVTWPAGSVTLDANASSGWTNMVVPINYAAAGLSNVSGIFLQMQTYATNGGGLPGTTLLWVDNLGATAFAGAGPEVTSASQSGTNVVLNCLNPGGGSGLYCVILSSPDLELPVAQWTPVATNIFHVDGTCSYTNFINPSQPAMYFTFMPHVAVTVLSSPSGRSFTVDGASCTTSQTFCWIPGSSHTIAATSPQSGSTGIQYVWSSWSDGGAMSHAVSPAGGTTYTANFSTQYYLTMNTGAGGGVSPASGWKNGGAVVPINATANGGYSFGSWTGAGSGSYSGTSGSPSITMNGPITETANFTPNIAVTVQANPPGCSFTVDGTNFTTSQNFSWGSGTVHTIATTSVQSGGAGIQYLWSSWSDGGAISHTVSPTIGTTYTANLTTQYYLTMSAGAGGGVSPASGWINSGALVPIIAAANVGYGFSSWTGTGADSYSGTTDAAAVKMNEPITETASFALGPGNISVTVQANPAGCSFTVDGTPCTNTETLGWVPGSNHTIATTSPQSGGTGVQYVWSSWSDGGAMLDAVSPTSGTTYTANFTTQYYLAMSASTGGSVNPGSGWNNSGAVVGISATASNGYNFNGWTGNGSGSYSGTSGSPSVTMNGPITETASFTINTVPPVSSFTMSKNMGVAPFTVTFTDTSIRNPISWFWTFGDGGTSTLQNPSHTFTNMWRQTVSLTASNAYGSNASSQPVYQCFPCDALYDWTNGIQGHPATLATLSNSLVGGANNIGFFTMTNFDLPSPNVQGIIFTNLPGMTNGCPVVFSNGVIYSNFNATNALAYCYTNQHEQYDFHFNASLVVTNIVLVFYDSLPLCTNVWEYCIDELNIATTRTYPDLGLYCLNRDLGLSPLPDGMNDCHTSETCAPTIYGYFPYMNNADFDGTKIYARPNKLYRILMQENTNSECLLAIADPVTSSLCGFVTNYNLYEMGHLITAYANGHTSFEVMTNNGYDQASWNNLTSILACHSIISINRPLNWFQATNVAMFGP